MPPTVAAVSFYSIETCVFLSFTFLNQGSNEAESCMNANWQLNLTVLTQNQNEQMIKVEKKVYILNIPSLKSLKYMNKKCTSSKGAQNINYIKENKEFSGVE